MAEDACIACLAYLGRLEEARRRLHTMIMTAPDVDNPLWTQNILGTAAHVSARLKDDERAARLLGAHEAHYQAGGAELNQEAEEHWHDQTGMNDARDRLGETVWKLSRSVGATLSTPEALAEVLEVGTHALGTQAHGVAVGGQGAEAVVSNLDNQPVLGPRCPP